MFNRRAAGILPVLFVVSGAVYAQPLAVQPVADPPKGIMSVTEVREGMRGTARSVFQGTRSEEFKVEILGVLPGYLGPKQDMIVGRLSGANAERTFVFAGMSGSPVYVNGRLLGAIAYSFPFAKEPICGITPFEQMVSLVETASPPIAAKTSATFDISDLTADRWEPSVLPMPDGPLVAGSDRFAALNALAGQTLRPIASPLMVSGISKEVLDRLSPTLSRAGFLPMAATAAGPKLATLKPADETTLLGGDSVVVHLARGDIQIAAAGTVTHRDGRKIYAFGHPFFGLGATELPMSESHVVTVVPNANNSFKLSVSDALVGTMTQDRATGIYGLLGREPRMLPVRIRLTTSRGRSEEVNFEAAVDEMLTPLILSMGVTNTLVANERSMGETTVEITGEINLKGHAPIRIERRFVGASAPIMAAAAGTSPLAALLRANFEGLEVTSVDFRLTTIDGSRTAVIDRVFVDHDRARPGDTVEIGVAIRDRAGRITTEKVPFVVPKEAAPGTVTITVGDGNAVAQHSASTQFTAASIGDLAAMIARLKRPDQLYLVVTRPAVGTVIGAKELPNLPPSMLATLTTDRSSGGLKPLAATILAESALPRGNYIVSGSQSVSLEIIR